MKKSNSKGKSAKIREIEWLKIKGFSRPGMSLHRKEQTGDICAVQALKECAAGQSSGRR